MEKESKEIPDNNGIAPETGTIQSKKSGMSRRMFVKASLATAPVILTVRSRPVWAANCTESGQLSGNISNGQDECFGEGCSPGFWKNHTEKWHYNYPTGSSFRDVFGLGSTPFLPENYDYTLYEVIEFLTKDNEHASDPIDIVLGFHAVAALQNAATSVKFKYTVVEVKEMVYNAYSGYRDKEDLKDELDYLNNLDCPW